MIKCWANSIGNCSDKISGEHLISNSLLEDNITVLGFPWCKDKPKTIGSASFTSKVLCTNHNFYLSDCDSEILKFKNYNNEFNRKIETFKKYGFSKKKCPIIYKVNGYLIEKWFCKTLINICMTNRDMSFENLNQIVPYIFGSNKFTYPYGLNVALQIGQLIKHNSNSNIFCSPLYSNIDNNKIEIAGGLFVFQGLHFIVILPNSKEPIRNNKVNLNLSDSNLIKDWNNLTLSWHHIEFNQKSKLRRKEYKLQSLILDWNE